MRRAIDVRVEVRTRLNLGKGNLEKRDYLLTSDERETQVVSKIDGGRVSTMRLFRCPPTSPTFNAIAVIDYDLTRENEITFLEWKGEKVVEEWKHRQEYMKLSDEYLRLTVSEVGAGR